MYSLTQFQKKNKKKKKSLKSKKLQLKIVKYPLITK